MKLTYREYRDFLKSYRSKSITLEESCAELAVQAERLYSVWKDCEHDLWDQNDFHVSPLKMHIVKKLRKQAPQEWTGDDFDRVMFSCFTTMGDENTYKWVLPRFMKFCATYPQYLGWASECHVQFTKFSYLDLKSLNSSQISSLLDAVDAFAYQELAMLQSDDLWTSKKSKLPFLWRPKYCNGPYRLLALTHRIRLSMKIN